MRLIILSAVLFAASFFTASAYADLTTQQVDAVYECADEIRYDVGFIQDGDTNYDNALQVCLYLVISIDDGYLTAYDIDYQTARFREVMFDAIAFAQGNRF